MTVRLALVSKFRDVDADVLSALRSLDYDVFVVIVDSLHPIVVSEALKNVNYDYAVVPGTSPFDYSGLRRVVKGTTSLKLLPRLLKYVSVESLSPSLSAERALEESLVYKALSETLNEIAGKTKWLKTGDVRLPIRPPPVVVFSDIYIAPPIDLERIAREVRYREWSGADAIVLSFDPLVEEEEILKVFKKALEEVEVPVAVDTTRFETLIKAVDLGAPIVFSLTLDALSDVPSGLRDRAFYVVIPRSFRSWRSRAEELARVCALAYELNVNVILDPLLHPFLHPGALEGLMTVKLVKEFEQCKDYPVLLGLNNAVELADVDTHASTATLLFLAAEAGASLVMVGEESYKARASTLEAKLASVLTSLALSLGSPPKDLPLNLLKLKGKSPREDIKYLGSAVFSVFGEVVDCRSREDVELCREWNLKRSQKELLLKYSNLFKLRDRR
ncbi:MAG: hypothetical protein QXP64_01280 [Acidilobaceae archaeon]